MTTRADDTSTSLTYTLRCVDCQFESTVEGDVFDVLDIVESHQEASTGDRFEHFVEFENEAVR